MAQATNHDITLLAAALNRGDVDGALAALRLIPEPAKPQHSFSALTGVSGHPEQALLSGLARLREQASAEVEQLIALLDILDGDPDLEPGVDREAENEHGVEWRVGQ